jgi:hypothetical protein
VAGFASSPAPVISGFSSISAENFTFLGNGVNILSTVGAGSYGNTQVASYLLNFDGDIEFTSSTARIGNVDVITVMDSIRSPAYQFSNGTSIFDGITGGSTYGNTEVAAYLPTYSGDLTVNFANISSLRANSGAIIGNVIINSRLPNYDAVIAYVEVGQDMLIESGNDLTLAGIGNVNIQPGNGNVVRFPAGMIPGTVQFDVPVNSINATDSTSISTGALTIAGGIGVAGNLNVGGNIVQQTAYYETYSNIANLGGNLTCNFNLGTVFYATLDSNVTANFTNVNAITSTVSGATIIVDQGATAYRVANVQVNGVNQTVQWIGAAAGVGTASNTDIVSFSLIHLGGGAYRVLGQQSSYG